ncbi:MAG: hypothetical protein ACU0DK_12425 [Pseudooceanicola sp.]
MIAFFVAGACILGLAIFATIVRIDPGAGQLRGLAAGIVLTALAGFVLMWFLPMNNGGGAGRLLAALALLWLAWIVVMGFVAQALRMRFPQSTEPLLLAAGLATMAPAAGLVAALWMG